MNERIEAKSEFSSRGNKIYHSISHWNEEFNKHGEDYMNERTDVISDFAGIGNKIFIIHN